MRLGIVATVKDSPYTIESFVRYHLELGFSLIYLFFDDPKDPALSSATHWEQVRVIPNNADLKQAWASLDSVLSDVTIRPYPSGGGIPYQALAEKYKTARQILNVDQAIRLAQQDGIDWLLHIDSDELFYIPGNDFQGHCAALEQAPRDIVTYYNLEAVPEQLNTERYFEEIQLFKVNRYRLLWREKILPGKHKLEQVKPPHF